MAFTGSATIKQISDNVVRITGLSLVAGAAGTIGLFHNSGTPGVRLPDAFKTMHYTYEGADVSFSDMLNVTSVNAATGVATAVPIAIVKTGTTTLDWVATITNTHASLATPDQEIYVRLH